MMFSFVTTHPTPIGKAASDTPSDTAPVPQPTNGPHCTLPIPADWLTCKISLKNTPSIHLFESLGFIRQSVSEVWQEVEMRYNKPNPSLQKQSDESIRQVLFWPEE